MKNSILLLSALISFWATSVAQEASNAKSDSAQLAQTIPHLKDIISKNEPITAQTETETCWWIGTNNGVYCIKKKNKKVKHYTEQNSDLPSNFITTMCATQDGEVYIGTDRGILRYDRFSFMIINIENSRLPSNNILELIYDSQKGIIVKTDAASLCVLK